MSSPEILVGDGVGASKVVSDAGVGPIVTVDGSGSAVIKVSEIMISKATTHANTIGTILIETVINKCKL